LREVLGTQRPRDGDNLGLWLDKLLPVSESNYELKGRDRERVLEDLFIARDLGKPRPWRSAAGKSVVERLRASCDVIYGPGNWRELRAAVRGRLLIDYGRVSAIESSLSLHPTLGVPRIPGSALKGMLRAALRPDTKAEELRRLLGSPDPEDKDTPLTHQRGQLVLHDAFPADGEFRLDLDVLTPHFGEYYRGTAPPADWLNPVPHTFLTVVDTTFCIFYGLLSPFERSPTQSSPADTLDGIRTFLEKALWLEGLGAKRSAGYGRLCILPDEPKKP